MTFDGIKELLSFIFSCDNGTGHYIFLIFLISLLFRDTTKNFMDDMT